MNIGQPFRFSEDQIRKRQRSIRLCWITIVLLLTTMLMWLTLGQSQAMKTAWAEDLLGMIPQQGRLDVAERRRRRDPARWLRPLLGRLRGGGADLGEHHA